MAMRQPIRRSDEEIRGAITRALARDGRIHTFDIIHVDVADGSVLLSGEVTNDEEKLGAGDVASQTPGVRGVDNRLTVGVNRSISDSQIGDAVLAALATLSPPLNAIGCQVQSGVVTLVGRVRDAADVRRAIDTAAVVKGVEAVRSSLEIRPEAPPPGPRTDDATLVGRVAQALNEVGVDVRCPDIRVEDAVATLNGVVESDSLRRRATHAAEAVEGIRAVRNRLRLVREPAA
jgi:hyperosmotically inducible protein